MYLEKIATYAYILLLFKAKVTKNLRRWPFDQSLFVWMSLDSTSKI